MRIFLVLLIAPLLEIAVFIAVGREIGILATIGLTLFTAILGTILLRSQGLKALREIQTDLAQDRVPARPLVDGAMITIAGLFLLTPGFISDFLGFCLFVPALRERIWNALAKHFTVNVRSASGRYREERPFKDGVVDLDTGDYADVDEAPRGAISDKSESPWHDPKKP